MSKWTDWIPYTGDECPVAYRERIKVKTLSGRVEKDMAGEFDWVDGGITHFKRRKKKRSCGGRESTQHRRNQRFQA